MRIRRSVTRFFGACVAPAIAIAITGYFGYYTVCGPRGLLALSTTNAKLTVESAKLASLQESRERLQHRIDLLAYGHADPDLVIQLARSQMLASSPGQIAVPRDH
jgi:cell division protein FtsB